MVYPFYISGRSVTLNFSDWLDAHAKQVDWPAVTDRWMIMMQQYNPVLDEQIRTVIATLQQETSGPCRILDLGCGPGTLARQILTADERFTVVNLDVNPFWLEVCKRNLADFGKRAQLLAASFRDADWPNQVPGPFQAVVSLTTLHSLATESYQALLNQILHILEPGSLFLNADRLIVPKFEPEEPDPDTFTGDTWQGYYTWLKDTWELTDIFDAAQKQGDIFDGSPTGYDGDTNLHLLTEAGFINQNMYWYRDGRAVFGGKKPT